MSTRLSSPGSKAKLDFAKMAIAAAFVIGGALTAVYLAMVVRAGHPPGSCDFVAYWATGQQFAHHLNPYDTAALIRLENAAGLGRVQPCYMRNPPWALPLTLPLGLLSAGRAVLPWSLQMLVILVVAVRIARTTLNLSGTGLEFLGYAFPPALLCVVMGQTSLFLLLGLVLFLRLHRTHPLAAGAALWLCTLKPHLFLPFGLVLLLWIVATRSYRILLGTGIAGAINVLLVQWRDPAVFRQYLHWAASSGIEHQPVPCLGVLLRNRLDPSAPWLAFVPAGLACLWAVPYFWRRRDRWDWREHGSLLMLVSLVAAPYCFVFDQSLALPALLYGASRALSRWPIVLLAGLFIAMEIQPILAPQLLSPGWRQLSAGVTWLVWYVGVRLFDRAADGVEVPRAWAT